MISALEDRLRIIVDVIDFHSEDLFSFAGVPSHRLTAHLSRDVSSSINGAVRGLESVLYSTCYIRRFQGTVEEVIASDSALDSDWLDNISAGHTSVDHWEEGWHVERIAPNGQVHAKRGETINAFWPGQFITRANQGMQPISGTPISVFFPREARSTQFGFVFLFGTNLLTLEDELSTVRYYWNVKRDSAVPLVRSLTAALNQYQVPFTFKIVNHPAFLDRSDTAVLYVGRRHYRIAAEIALDVHSQLSGGFNPEVPLFTLPLALGLAFAEDPGSGESFGTARCRLLAEGLWYSFAEGCLTSSEKLDRVRSHFVSVGTSFDRPYLRTASLDLYEFPQ